MQKTKKRLSREWIAIMYYSCFLSAIALANIFFPGTAHFPGLSFPLTFMLLITGIAYFLMQFASWISDKCYSKCLLIHLGMWLGIWISIQCDWFFWR